MREEEMRAVVLAILMTKTDDLEAAKKLTKTILWDCGVSRGLRYKGRDVSDRAYKVQIGPHGEVLHVENGPKNGEEAK